MDAADRLDDGDVTAVARLLHRTHNRAGIGLLIDLLALLQEQTASFAMLALTSGTRDVLLYVLAQVQLAACGLEFDLPTR